MKKTNLIPFIFLLPLALNVGCKKQMNATNTSLDLSHQQPVTSSALTGLISPEGYNLFWSEEFNYTGLPDSTIWDYETGYVRGPQLQYYTVKREANAYVQNGNLELTAIKEEYPNAEYVRGSTDWRKKDSLAQYTSASLTSKGKMAYKYGRMEVGVKVPQGNGMWPAIWMMGANHPTVGWPRCGEVDILEYFGKTPANITSNFHYANAAGAHVSSNYGSYNLYYPYSAFHVYTLDWDTTTMTISVDGTQITTFSLSTADLNGDNAFRKPFFLLLSNQIGSWGGTPTGTVDTTKLPAKFLVDYVRIYKRNLVANGGLEGTPMSPWTIAGNTASLTTDVSKIRTGLQAIQVSGTLPSSIEQVITGLKPSTTYIFGGYAKVGAAGQKGQIGVKNFDGTNAGISATISSTSYMHGSVTFTTGPANTSAKVYYYRPLPGTVYGDDFYLNEQE